VVYVRVRSPLRGVDGNRRADISVPRTDVKLSRNRQVYSSIGSTCVFTFLRSVCRVVKVNLQEEEEEENEVRAPDAKRWRCEIGCGLGRA